MASDAAKPSFLEQVRSYPRQFWVANTMEIFERLSWYGWFTVMALYVTGSPDTGGLGFSTETRGTLQAIVPFFLYLLPVFTGAIADRYGYKRSFIIAFSIMIAAYYLLGQFTSLPGFFLAFMFVAVGAGIFKPVVVGTVAKVTNDSNSSMAFGIFYMMVNIGGFVGPIVAGLVRGWGWEYVFYASSGWAIINLIIVLTLYEEPPVAEGQRSGSLRQVLDTMVEVIGNFRFFLTIFVVLFLLMFANLRVGPFEAFTWTHAAIAIPVWIALNFLWDALLPKNSGDPANDGARRRSPWMRRMRCSNWRFAVFLLIMSGFWTAFNQIFLTMPEYIRDFTDTRSMTSMAEGLFGEDDSGDPNSGVASNLATVNPQERAKIHARLAAFVRVLRGDDAAKHELEAWAAIWEPAVDIVTHDERPDDAREAALVKLIMAAYATADVDELSIGERKVIVEMAQDVAHIPAPTWETARVRDLLDTVHDVPQVAALTPRQAEALRKAAVASARALLDTKVRILPSELIRQAAGGPDVDQLTDHVIITARQVNPEYIINIDALAIILFQVFVSFIMARMHQFKAMILGMLVAAVGIGLPFFAGAEGVVGVGASAWIVSLSLLIFAFGEMMASPTSQEYVGRIAPPDRKAVYMGYYFVAVALGNLFGGILSGELYGHFARDLQRPDLMWLLFGGLMVLTALLFVVYDRFALPRGNKEQAA